MIDRRIENVAVTCQSDGRAQNDDSFLRTEKRSSQTMIESLILVERSKLLIEQARTVKQTSVVLLEKLHRQRQG